MSLYWSSQVKPALGEMETNNHPILDDYLFPAPLVYGVTLAKAFSLFPSILFA